MTWAITSGISTYYKACGIEIGRFGETGKDLCSVFQISLKDVADYALVLDFLPIGVANREHVHLSTAIEV